MDSSLPLEILIMILDEIKDSRTALRSCILINKNWYGAAIRYLWDRPFALLCAGRSRKSKSKKYRRQANSLLTTFVECFTDIKAIQEVFNISKTHNKKLGFDYSMHVQEVCFEEVGNVVKLWDGLNRSLSSTKDEIDRITARVVGLAIQYCQQLKTISLTPNYLSASYQLIQSLGSA